MSFYNGHVNNVGKLSMDGPHRRDGKKVFDWEFTTPGAPESIAVEVVVLKGDEKGLQFKASSKRLRESLFDSDINRLHQKVEEALIDQVASISNIAWEDWLEVVVRGESSERSSQYAGMGANLHVQVNPLKRGTQPVTGKPVTINSNRVVVAFPCATSIELDPETLDVGGLSGGGLNLRLRDKEEKSYVPATQENIRALKDLLDRMSSLRSSLAALLSQEVVQKRLESIDKHLPPMLEDSSGSASPKPRLRP